jgi:hypothetical protein
MRRRTAVVMLWFAVAAAVVAVAASVAASARYAAFRPLSHPFLAICVTSVLAIVALHTLMRESTARLHTQTSVGVLSLCTAAAGLLYAKVSPLLLEAYDPRVIATAPDVTVVAWRQELTFDHHVVLRLRSRHWLLSRDGTADLACFTDPLSARALTGPNAGWYFASAGVTGATLVARTADGREWRAGFDPATLRPTTPLIDRCSGADYVD